MKIKRVEILGFKSFVDKASLDFQQGITSVVGPNGCGKSNIVDAIRWAMGEQNAKNLRGRSMEDVIFGGSESRKPLGMAEVSMIFSNEEGLGPPAFRDYAEIMVTRRLYRSGESEYLLNKTPCRLLDITELFMDTGIGARAYSIIEQGKIGMILSAKAEDRRFLIEEAAGVTKFKSRKKSALRKIEATRQNLLRLGDVVSEVRRQLGSLKRQAQKAQRYREFREELKEIETRLAYLRYAELQDEKAGLQRSCRDQERTLEGLSGQLEKGELTLEELRLLQAAAEKEVAAGQERVFHLSGELQQVEGRIGFGQKEFENLGRQRERLLAETEEVRQRQNETDREEEALQQSGNALGCDLEQEQQLLADGEAALEELSEEERDVSTRLEATRSTLFALLSDLSRLANLHEDARRRLDSLTERTARNRQEAVGLREQMEEAQELMGELEVTLHGFRQRRATLLQDQIQAQEALHTQRRQLEETENTLLVRREEASRSRSRLESLQELERNLEGYGGGVKTLLKTPGMQDRFAGLAADAMEVPGAYEVAVEAVLGERLQTLLGGGVADVGAALELLREKGGRSTFLLAGGTPSPKGPGRSLGELVRPRAGAEPQIAALLAGAFLVESFEPYYETPLAPGTLLVNPAGETLSWRGELTGGAPEGFDQGMLHKKREIKELAALVVMTGREVEGLQERRLQLREALQETEEGLRELGAALHRKELKVADSEKDLARLRQENERLLERIEVLSLEEDQLHEEREALDEQLDEASRGRSAKEREKEEREAEVVRLQEELQLRRRAVEEARERVTARKVAVASLREREEGSRRSLERLGRLREELRGRLVLLQGREEEIVQEQGRLQAEGERLRVELDLLYRRREEEKGRYEALRERFDQGAQGIETREEELKGVRGRLNQAREEHSALQLRERELDLEMGHLRESFLERYRLDLLDLQEPGVVGGEDFDPETAGSRLAELRRLIGEMGEVNLTAIEEYRELEERFSFLTTQQEDLRLSLEGLQTAIGKINRTTRKRFRETFDQVNAKFQEVFPRLFRGGQAELRLTDEADLLETGIDIVVQPPGKKLQSVNLLSGGEKALTAVALIFSIFLIKPSPFCMLDEVDAPLDEANIGRFNELVREMSAISQFIIITHNKRTMEIADSLYGVTMEEPGVSKLVSVRINDF